MGARAPGGAAEDQSPQSPRDIQAGELAALPLAVNGRRTVTSFFTSFRFAFRSFGAVPFLYWARHAVYRQSINPHFIGISALFRRARKIGP
jgi:hypothetical protein